jgi:hypothetical protein
MPVLNPNTTEGQTALGIIADALIEIGAIAQGDGIPDGMGQWALRKLNRMMDQWAARRLFIYDQSFTAYTLTPNLNPHTIGPNGTFNVAQRPTRIVSAAVILNNVSVAIDVPIPVLDDDQWAEVKAKPLTSTQPIAVYYAAGWPLGSLYFWPIPTTAYGIRLETWSTLTQFADLSHRLHAAAGLLGRGGEGARHRPLPRPEPAGNARSW